MVSQTYIATFSENKKDWDSVVIPLCLELLRNAASCGGVEETYGASLGEALTILEGIAILVEIYGVVTDVNF